MNTYNCGPAKEILIAAEAEAEEDHTEEPGTPAFFPPGLSAEKPGETVMIRFYSGRMAPSFFRASFSSS